MSVSNVYGHTTLKIPVLVRSPKSSKQRRARLVLGWVTAWEYLVLKTSFFSSFLFLFFFFFFSFFLALLCLLSFCGQYLFSFFSFVFAHFCVLSSFLAFSYGFWLFFNLRLLGISGDFFSPLSSIFCQMSTVIDSDLLMQAVCSPNALPTYDQLFLSQRWTYFHRDSCSVYFIRTASNRNLCRLY